MQTPPDTICIAALDPPTLWNFYPSMKAALADLDTANCSTLPQAEQFKIMRYGEYREHHKLFWQSRMPGNG